MQNTFIHIGFPKTGSTYLQSQIFANLEEISFLTPPHTQHDELWNKMQYGDSTQFKVDEFNNSLNSIKYLKKDLLISDEGLVGKPIYGGMQRTLICKRLKQSFPDAKILIVIRGQFEMLKSLHNQWIKGARKGTKTFGDFIWYKKTKYNPKARFTLDNMYFNTNEDYVHLDFLNYFELINLYKENFSEVKVLPYELMLKDLDTYILEVSNFLGIRINTKNLIKTKRNLRLSEKNLAKNIVVNSLINLPITRLESKILIARSINSISKKNEKEYDSNFELIKSYFRMSNSKLIEFYPEVGIQNFLEHY